MWDLVGQDHILRQLEFGLKWERLAHAYLLTGPGRVGKMTLAVELAKALNCTGRSDHRQDSPCGVCSQCTRTAAGSHADVRVVSKVSRAESSRSEREAARTVIGIQEVREVLHQVSLKPFEGSRIVVIFDGVESLSDEAANALLKTLEEPPEQVTLLLLTANEDAILPTIRSRCRRLSLLPVPQQQMVEALVSRESCDRERAGELARLSRGCYGWARSILHEPDLWDEREQVLDGLSQVCQSGLEERFAYANELATRFSRDRDSAQQLLFEWQRWWRDLLLIKEGADGYLHNAARADELRLQATGVTTAQVVAFLERINKTLTALEQNANARLACEVLMLNLPRGSG